MSSTAAPPDMDAVPNNVKSLGSSADEMMKRLAEGKDPRGRDEAPGNEPDPKPTHPTPEPERDTGQEEHRPETNRDQRREAQPPEQREPRQDGDNWEHKYNSLRGSFDRTNKRVKALEDDNRALREIIANLEAGAAAAPADTGDAARAAYEELTPEEQSEYGDEFFKVVGKVVGKELAAARKEIEDLKRQVGGVAAATVVSAQDKMHATLDQRVPDWKELNDDPEFVEWVKKPAPGTGQLRQALLLQAYKRNSAPDVAFYFEQFLREERGETRDPAPQGASEGQGRAPAPKTKSLEDYAAPGKGKQGDLPGKDAPKPKIHLRDITKFYADSTAGKYAGKEEERARREAEIFAAQAEGRIVRD